jgi:hypothetical protein
MKVRTEGAGIARYVTSEALADGDMVPSGGSITALTKCILAALGSLRFPVQLETLASTPTHLPPKHIHYTQEKVIQTKGPSHFFHTHVTITRVLHLKTQCVLGL